MTLKTSPYEQLTREELIQLLEARDNEPDRNKVRTPFEAPAIKRIISEVLVILFNEEKDPIGKAMRVLLDYFNADWGYVAIFEEDGQTANFICEVMSEWVKVPKDDQSKLTYDTIPWIIDTVRDGHDIVLGDIAMLPSEAATDKALLTEQQLKSMLIIPLTFHNKVQGFIGFDSVRIRRFWTIAEVEDMHLTASIFSIIIERWQTNNNLEESRKRISQLSTKFQQFFNNLPIGVELYDSEGYLIDVNEADCKIFGTKYGQLIGANLFKNPSIPTKILNQISKGKTFNFSFAYDFNIIRDTGYYSSSFSDQIKYLLVKGISLTDHELRHIGYLFFISDETEKQQEKERTQNNLAILKAGLLSGHSLVAEYDIEKKELYVDPLLNEAGESNKLFNYLRNNKHMTLENVQQIVRTTDNVNQLFQVINGVQNHCSFICRTVIENETIWIRINAQAYKIKGCKQLNKMVCHVTDITEEKLLEEKLYHAEYETRQSELEIQKVREADKLKSAFLANMSHEIRTPLNAIIGFSGILAETEDKEEKEEFIKIINKNSDLLLRLITDILDFSKIESGILDYSLTDASLKEICYEQHQVHSLKMPDGVELICDFDSLPDITVHTDPKRITQVISNLISNAAKFTEKGSITLSYRIMEGRVLVEVTDTGIGISPQNQHTIFERFVKVDSFKQGTGLGLTICKTIIEALNGTIGVDSKQGEGSRFWFTLPYNG